MTTDDVDLKLSRQEALVFFDWLASLDETTESATRDEAQQSVLWRIEGKLERVLVEVVLPDYLDLVAHAKQSVLGKTDP